MCFTLNKHYVFNAMHYFEYTKSIHIIVYSNCHKNILFTLFVKF